MQSTLDLNGEQKTVAIEEGETPLETLPNHCGIISTQDGCQPQGRCACCLALVDGKPEVTCAQSAQKADGAQILTLERVISGERDRIARSFAAAAGLQSGFCIPGFALRAKGVGEIGLVPLTGDSDTITQDAESAAARLSARMRSLP